MLLLLLLLSRFSCIQLCATPYTAAHQAPLSLRFSRQEHWNGLQFPSPMHESEKWKWSRLAMSDSSWSHGLQPTRLLHPWEFPGKSTGVGWVCLLQEKLYTVSKNKTWSWLWLRSWAPYCKIQALLEESRENQETIQVWAKSNRLWLYNGGDK